MNPFRQLPLSLVALLGLVLSNPGLGEQTKASRKAQFPEKHLILLEDYCYSCHDSATHKGKFDMEELSFDVSSSLENAARWQHVLDAMNSGEMPPEDEEQIPAKDKTSILEDLSTTMVEARQILSDSGGVITLRRLNRREYENTLEELIGVKPDVSGLPDDEVSTKYDTSGDSLYFSADQLEEYLKIARHTLKTSIEPDEANRKKFARIEPEERANKFYTELLASKKDRRARAIARRNHRSRPATDFGFIDDYQANKTFRGRENGIKFLEDFTTRPENKTGTSLILTIKAGMNRIKLPTIPANEPGDYLIRVRAAAYKQESKRMQYLEFVAKNSGSQYSTRLGWRKVDGAITEPGIVEFPYTHLKGVSTSITIHQRTHQDRGDKNLWTLDYNRNGYGTPPGVWVDWAEIIPLPPKGTGAESNHPIFIDAEPGWDEETHAAQIIRRFAQKAFRTQDLTEETFAKLFEHYRIRRKSGEKFRQALISPLSIILSSPAFLYLNEVETDGPNISDEELAVRLAYFLWSAPPDDELLSIARNGGLSNPEILAAQTDRMMEDERFDHFIHGFVRQWLEMDRLEIFQFEARLYRDFDNATRESAGREIYETFRLIIDESLPLSTLLDSEFLVINDVLADYYGIPGVDGPEFRKIQVPDGSPRGGLLASAAVLAMGSDGIRTSPVERGAWILRHLLNDPPPPAPPNVPQLARLEGEVLSSHDLQRAHQEEPQCAQCHLKIDPLGFALENFDASGSWRDTERIYNKRFNGELAEFPIDPAGQLPNGMSFSDFFSLRESVAGRDFAFATGLLEAMISYGLGRPFGFSDELTAETILKDTQSNGFEIGSLIHGLVQSDLFKRK